MNFGDTCKETHSIIKATDSQVQAICQKGGNPMGNNFYLSFSKLDVVTCTYKKGITKTIKLGYNFLQ